MEKEKQICPACGGSGYVIESDIRPGCCGNFTKYGSCCGNAVPEPYEYEVPCEYCETTGEIEIDGI